MSPQGETPLDINSDRPLSFASLREQDDLIGTTSANVSALAVRDRVKGEHLLIFIFHGVDD